MFVHTYVLFYFKSETGNLSSAIKYNIGGG